MDDRDDSNHFGGDEGDERNVGVIVRGAQPAQEPWEAGQVGAEPAVKDAGEQDATSVGGQQCRRGSAMPPESLHYKSDVGIPSSSAKQPVRPPEFTDDALALTFTNRHRDRLRYVAAWGQWLMWDGARWAVEGTLQVFDMARGICREASAECNQASTAKKLADARTIAAVERLARADRHHAATVDQWDTDPWLLNTPSGIIDLKTGGLRQHDRDDYMTKITAVAPGGDCTIWKEFLHRVTDGGSDLQQYLQRMAGYALTGLTIEHAFFFLYGTGANGKSVFVNAISKVLGDHATTAPIETFIKSNVDRHPTDLAGLRGARLVIATETEEGRRWAESKIKALTGGDAVSARFMRQDFFEFTPTFKLIVAGNHRPGLRSVDEAIRRRMNLIPFTVTIPPEERDETLSEKLKDEWPGILEWMIAGCLDWQERGLDPPEAVRKATDEYLETEDALSAWMAECCLTRETHYATSGELFQSWKEWAEKAGEFVGSQKRLSQNIQARGFESKRQSGTGRMGFTGISVVKQDELWGR